MPTGRRREEGYLPQRLSAYSAVLASQGQHLHGLVSRPLTRLWTVWDLGDDEWFADCPVLLDFDGEQVEVNHHKLDDLSTTWNTVNPRDPVQWPGLDLRRRHDALPEPLALQGQLLHDVELLEWAGDALAHGSVAVSFVFPETRVTIFDALDENGLHIGPPDPHYQRHSLR